MFVWNELKLVVLVVDVFRVIVNNCDTYYSYMVVCMRCNHEPPTDSLIERQNICCTFTEHCNINNAVVYGCMISFYHSMKLSDICLFVVFFSLFIHYGDPLVILIPALLSRIGLTRCGN